MSDNKLQKRIPNAIREKGQYILAFGVIASMLLVTGFPLFVVFFFGIFGYLLWKMFTSGSKSETREIFEFYLSANEILRDDERRWFGFEIQEVIFRGEHILQTMNGAPPLVYFTLGALYNKTGDHKTAVNHLSYVVENENAGEATYLHPSPELRHYARVLRKIEREPAEAPMTSAAVRALERARKNRGKVLLENSREHLKESNRQKREASEERRKAKGEIAPSATEIVFLQTVADEAGKSGTQNGLVFDDTEAENSKKDKQASSKDSENPFTDHKSISEVLYDIYDRK